MGGLVGLKGLPVKGEDELREGLLRIVEGDMGRGWAVALGWMLSSLVECVSSRFSLSSVCCEGADRERSVVYLYYLVRRPTHILDFSITLIFNHAILTTYYSSSFPSSLFYWTTLTLSTIAQVVLAEQWCVQREMREAFVMDSDIPPPTPLLGGERRGSARDDEPRGSVRGEERRGSFKDDIEMGRKKGGGGYERVPGEER